MIIIFLKNREQLYSLLENGYNIGYLKEDPKPTSGFAGKEKLKNIHLDTLSSQ